MQTYQDQFRHVYNWLYSGEPLRTRQFPIVVDDTGVPLVAVFEDGAAVDVSFWDVYPEEGTLYRLDGTTVAAWLGTTLLVDYTAGYDPIPADVQSAALEWLTARWFAVGRDPALRSETIPDLIGQVYAGDAGAGTSGGASAGRPRPAGALQALVCMTPQVLLILYEERRIFQLDLGVKPVTMNGRRKLPMLNA